MHYISWSSLHLYQECISFWLYFCLLGSPNQFIVKFPAWFKVTLCLFTVYLSPTLHIMTGT